MRQILITGGGGFIGSHLAEHHLAMGDSVHVIDDLSTGAVRNLDGVRRHPRFSATFDSINRKRLLLELIDRADWVYHLAAAVGVQLIVKSPVRTIETNIHGTEVVLQLCARKNKKVLVASTSEVYGKSTKFPFREDDDLVLGPTTKGRWAYACSKATDEFLAIAYHREKGLPTVVTRFFNTVGPRQTGQYGMVVPRFVRWALRAEPIQVYGTGEQQRCFTYVKDTVRILPKLMECPRAEGEVFNIGGTEEISMIELARKIIERTDSSSPIQLVPYDRAYGRGFEDMPRRVPSVEKLQRVIGDVPQTLIDATLDAVIEYEQEIAGGRWSVAGSPA